MNNMIPTVTIGLPCYNAGQWLRECLDSILAQSLQNWELIAVDDGSTDDTPDILQRYAAQDPRIRVVSDGMNKGRCVRLNQIADSATGPFIARMDADDIMLPERLEKQVACLESHPEVDLVGGGLISIDAQGKSHGKRLLPPRIESPYRILKGEVLFHPTVTGRTEWFKSHPYMPEFTFSDDFALWAKYASELTISNVQEPVIKYREHELFTYEKYCGRKKENLEALRRFGPASVPSLQLRKLILRRRLKDSIYWLFHVTGLWKHAFRLSRKKA